MEKKISIKYFLNKRIAPHIHAGEEHYPIYAQVTFNRKNTQFKISLRDYLFTDEHLEHFLAPNATSDLSDNDNTDLIYKYVISSLLWKEKMILKLVDFELEHFRDKFTLKGFGKRFEYFEQDLPSLVKSQVHIRLLEELRSSLSLSHFFNVQKLNFYSVLEYLIEHLSESFPDLIAPEVIKLLPLYHFVDFAGMLAETPVHIQISQTLPTDIADNIKELGVKTEERTTTISLDCSIYAWYFNGVKGKLFEFLSDASDVFDKRKEMGELMEKYEFGAFPFPIKIGEPPLSQCLGLYMDFIEFSVGKDYPYK